MVAAVPLAYDILLVQQIGALLKHRGSGFTKTLSLVPRAQQFFDKPTKLDVFSTLLVKVLMSCLRFADSDRYREYLEVTHEAISPANVGARGVFGSITIDQGDYAISIVN